MTVLVVIPTFNEASTIIGTLRNLFELHPEVSVLVVDDSSPDGTAALVRQLGDEQRNLFVLERPRKQGLGVAYLAGFRWGFEKGFDQIVEMDADGSHRAEDLSKLLNAVQHADLVIGSRWILGGQVINWSALRKLVSKVGNRYAKSVLRTEIYDMTSGFRIYQAEFLKQLLSENVSSHGYSFQVELAYRASRQGKVLEVPITFVERSSGESKMTLAIVFEALTKVTFWGLKRLLR